MTPIVNETQAVMSLHDIARYVENHYGTGELSKDIRGVADRLNQLTKPTAALLRKKEKENN